VAEEKTVKAQCLEVERKLKGVFKITRGMVSSEGYNKSKG